MINTGERVGFARLATRGRALGTFGKYARYSALYRQHVCPLTRPAYCIPYPCGSMRARTRGPTRSRPRRAEDAMLKDPAFMTTRPAAYCSIAGTRGESRKNASPGVTRGANATRASPRFDARPESWAFLLPAHLRRRCVWPPAATWRARGTQRAKSYRGNR